MEGTKYQEFGVCILAAEKLLCWTLGYGGAGGAESRNNNTQHDRFAHRIFASDVTIAADAKEAPISKPEILEYADPRKSERRRR